MKKHDVEKLIRELVPRVTEAVIDALGAEDVTEDADVVEEDPDTTRRKLLAARIGYIAREKTGRLRPGETFPEDLPPSQEQAEEEEFRKFRVACDNVVGNLCHDNDGGQARYNAGVESGRFSKDEAYYIGVRLGFVDIDEPGVKMKAAPKEGPIDPDELLKKIEGYFADPRRLEAKVEEAEPAPEMEQLVPATPAVAPGKQSKDKMARIASRIHAYRTEDRDRGLAALEKTRELTGVGNE